MFASMANALDDESSGLLKAVQNDVGSALSAAQSLPVVGHQLGDFGAVTALTGLRDRLTSALNTLDSLTSPPTDVQIRQTMSDNLNQTTTGLSISLSSLGITGPQVAVSHPNGGLAVEMHLRLIPTMNPVTFSTGLPNLPFSTSATIAPSITIDYQLAFQYDPNAGTSINYGARLNDLNQSTNPNHSATVTVGLASGLQGVVNASAGIVQGQLSINSGNSLNAVFSLDGLNKSVPDLGLSGGANLDVHLRGGFGTVNTSAEFPSISADLVVAWPFSTNDPTVSFKNVTLDLGTFLSHVLEPIVSNIKSVGETLAPVFEVLNKPLPGISDLSRFVTGHDVSLMTLAKIAASDSGYGPLADLITQVGTLATEASRFQDANGVSIRLGDFDLNDVKNTNTAQLQPTNLSQLSAAGIPSSDQALINQLKGTNPVNFTFAFPIFDNPAQCVFQMLLGRHPDLVKLTADVQFTADSNQLPGLSVAGVGVTFSGNAVIKAHLELGYDTTGLEEMYRNPNSNFIQDMADGFYINADPSHPRLLDLNASLGVGPEFSFGIVTIGMHGGITTGQDITLTLNDPGGDHKIRATGLDFAHPFTFIHAGGTLDATLDIYIQIGVTILGDFIGLERHFGLAQATLLDFSHVDPYNYPPNPPPDVIAVYDPSDNTRLDLLIGQSVGYNDEPEGAAQRMVNGVQGVDDAAHPDDYTITYVDGDAASGDTLDVTAFGVTKRFYGIKSIWGTADKEDVTINVESLVDADAHLWGGNRTANFTYSGVGDAYLTGGDADSILIGGNGNNYLLGGNGNDQITGGPHANILNGGGGQRNRIVVPVGGDGIFIGGTVQNGADNTLEVLAPPIASNLSIGPDSQGVDGFSVLARDNDGNIVTRAAPFNIQNVVIGGGNTTHITIGDLSGTSLHNLSVSVPSDAAPTGGTVTSPPSQTNAPTALDRFFTPPGRQLFTELSYLRGANITIAGSAISFAPDYFEVSTTSGNGATDLLVHLRSPKLFSSNSVTYGDLWVDVAGMTSDEDALTLDGRGGNDNYSVTPDPKLNFALTIDNSGSFSRDSVSVDARALPAVDYTINDDGVNNGENNGVTLDYTTGGGSSSNSQNQGVPQFHTEYVLFGDGEYVDSLTVNGSYAANHFISDRTVGSTTLDGGVNGDTFDVRGASAYVLDGGIGDDQYLVHWGLGNNSVTIPDNSSIYGDTLEVDDSANYGQLFSQYQVTSSQVYRAFRMVGQTQPFVSVINLSNMAAVTLDTGHGTYVPNLINLFAMSFGTDLTLNTEDGINVVDVLATAAAATTTINAGGGVNVVTIESSANRGTTDINATGGTNAVTVNCLGADSINAFTFDGGTNTLDVKATGDDSSTTITTGAGTNSIEVESTGRSSSSSTSTSTTTINTGTGTNTVVVDATGTNSTTTINTGSGHDTVELAKQGQSLDAIAGKLTVYGNNATALTLDDQHTLALLVAPVSYDVGNQELTRTAYQFNLQSFAFDTLLKRIDYHNLASLSLNVMINPPRNDVNVGKHQGAAQVVVNTGASNSQVAVTGSNTTLDGVGNIVVNGGASTNLVLDDRASQTWTGAADWNLSRGGDLQVETYQVSPAYVINATGLVRTNTTIDTVTSNIYGTLSNDINTYQDAISYANLGNVEIRGSATGSVFNVLGIAAGTTLTIDGGNAVNVPVTLDFGGHPGGSDTVNVGDATHTLDGIGTLVVHGGTSTTVNLDDERTHDVPRRPAIQIGSGIYEAFQASPKFRVSDSYVTRQNDITDTVSDDSQILAQVTNEYIAIIAFDHLAGLTIHGGRSQSVFDVQSASSATPVTITAGNNNDVVDVGNNDEHLLQGIQLLTVHGGTGTSLVLDDTGNIASPESNSYLFDGEFKVTNPNYQMSDQGVVRTDDVTDPEGERLYRTTINYDHVANVEIDGGFSPNSFSGSLTGDFNPTLTLTKFSSAALDVAGDFRGSFLAPTVGTLAAPIDHITVGGSMLAGSRIKVKFLNALTVGGNVDGTIDGYGFVTNPATQFTIGTVTVNGGTWGGTGSITAPSIGSINMQPASSFAGQATETMPGADFQSLALGTVTSTGVIKAGAIVNASVSGDMAGQIIVTGALGTLSVGGDLTGSVSAGSIGTISVGGSRTGGVTATVDGAGLVRFTSAAGVNDTITVSLANGVYAISDAGIPSSSGTFTFTIPQNRVSAIQIDTVDGTDLVELASLANPVNVTASAGANAAVVVGGTGRDMRNILGPVNVTNPNGVTSLYIDDSNDTVGRTATLSDGRLSGLSPADVTWTATPPGTVKGGMANVQLFGGSGNNTFNVNDTDTFYQFAIIAPGTGTSSNAVNVRATTAPLLVIPDGGTDVVTVGSLAPALGGSLAGIHGYVDIRQYPGSITSLVIDDEGTTTSELYTVTATEVNRSFINAPGDYIPDMAPIYYSHISNLALRGASEAKTPGEVGWHVFSVESTSAGTTTDVYGGSSSYSGNNNGLDEFLVGNPNTGMEGIQGPLGLHGHAGSASLTSCQDFEYLHPGLTYTLTAGGVSRTGIAPIMFDGMGYVAIGTNEPGAIFNVLGTTPNMTTYVGARAGDLVTVGGPSPTGNTLAGILGPLVILADNPTASSGLFPVVIDDSGDTNGHPKVAISTAAPDDVQLTGLAPAPISFRINPASPISIRGGLGDDTFTVSAPVSYTGITIDGGGGVNTLIYDDQATTADETYTVTANTVGETGAGSIGYADMANLAVYAGRGSLEVLNIISTASGTTTDVYASNSQATLDEIAVGSGLLDLVQGPVAVHGRTAQTLLGFGDWANTTAGQTYNLSAGALNRPGKAPITYDGIIAYDVLYTSQFVPSVVNVQSNGNIPTYVAAGPGDVVTLGNPIAGQGSTLANIQGYVILSSYRIGALPAVVIDDSGDTTDRQVVLSPYSQSYDYQLTGLAPGQILVGLDPATPISIRGGLGNDTLTVSSPVSYTGITIDGGGGSNTLVGPDAANAWTVTGSNKGTLGPVAFASIKNLFGGSAADTFAFRTGGGIDGTLDGRGGVNALDYSGYKGDVTVDLALNLASLVNQRKQNSVFNIQNVTGSQGNDMLVGDANANVFIGGTGRNVLIGGAGADTLDATLSKGDNILIGGFTDWDKNIAALDAIMAEWTRTDLNVKSSFQARYNDLVDGSGTTNPSNVLTVNGQRTLILLSPATNPKSNNGKVHADGATDTLKGTNLTDPATGARAHNWFFYDDADATLVNFLNSSDHKNRTT